MDKILVLAKKELASYFDSLIAYVMIILFLGFSGFFTWLDTSNVFVQGQASLQVFFGVSYWTLFFFTAAITMRTLAEETKSGTIELLMTKSITDWQIVVGKFIASVALIGLALACTVPFYLTVSKLGSVDHGAIIGGYFGLLLLSSAYVSLGIFISSLTNNQIVAFLITLAIGICFHWIFGKVASSSTGFIAGIFNYLDAQNHFQSLARGVVDSRDIIYFASFIFTGLFLSQTVLSKRNWKD